MAKFDPQMLLNNHASLSTIVSEAKYTISNLAPSDLFIFYYAGYGCQIEGFNRLTALACPRSI